jgi:hypothetical protein
MTRRKRRSFPPEPMGNNCRMRSRAPRLIRSKLYLNLDAISIFLECQQGLAGDKMASSIEQTELDEPCTKLRKKCSNANKEGCVNNRKKR